MLPGLSHTGSHHEREGLRQRDNAGVCATAPEWRLALSDRSRLTTTAARIVEVKGKWTAWSCLWDAPTEVRPPYPTAVSHVMGGKLCFFERCLVRLVWCELCEQGCSSAVLGKQRSGSWRFTRGEAPLSVFWQGHHSVWMELSWKKVLQKEAQWKACVECDLDSAKEKSMKTWMGEKNYIWRWKHYRDAKQKRDELSKNYFRCERRGRWRFTVVKIEAEWRWGD